MKKLLILAFLVLGSQAAQATVIEEDIARLTEGPAVTVDNQSGRTLEVHGIAGDRTYKVYVEPGIHQVAIPASAEELKVLGQGAIRLGKGALAGQPFVTIAHDGKISHGLLEQEYTR